MRGPHDDEIKKQQEDEGPDHAHERLKQFQQQRNPAPPRPADAEPEDAIPPADDSKPESP